MSFWIPCPHCAFQISAEPEHAGMTGPCPRCQTQFVIPKMVSDQIGPSLADSEVTINPESEISARPTILSGSFATLSPEAPKTVVNRSDDAYLERLEVIGKGGMGIVYRVLDKRLNRHAALKTLSRSQGLELAAERFLREAELTSQLDHPNIPPIYEMGQNKRGEYYILMRLVQGRDLSAKIKEYHEDGSPELLSSLLGDLVKVCEAISYAHGQGILHRDLKPDNIRVGEFGEVLVMDWGLAKRIGEAESQAVLELAAFSPELAADQGLTLAGSVMGTPGYMSPEQAAGEVVDERTDVFALGAILCEILTGDAPFLGEGHFNILCATLQGRIELPRDRDSKVPRELHAIAKSALNLDKSQRLASALDLAANLQCFVNDKPVSVYHYSVTERILAWSKRHPTLLIASSILLLFSTLSTFFWAQKSRAERIATEQIELRSEQQGAYEKGLEIFTQLERLQSYRFQPLKAELEENLFVFRVRRDIGEQIDSLSLLIKNNPNLPALHVLAAKAHLQLYQFDRCRQHVDSALARDPKSGAAWLLKGQLLSQSLIIDVVSGGSKELLASRAAEISLCFDNAEAEGIEIERTHLVWLAIVKNDAAGFQSLISELKDKVDQSEIDFLKGVRLFLKRDYYRSEKKAFLEPFVACLKRCPRHYGARLILSIACGDLDLSEFAIQNAELVLRMNPDFAEVWMNKGIDLMRLKRFSEASLALDRAIELKPKFAQAHLNRGNLASRRKKPDKAAECYAEALRLDPGLALAYLNRARLWRRLSRFREAEADYKRLLDLEPKNSFGHFGLGMLYGQMGKSPEISIRLFLKAIESHPRYAQAYYNLAVLFRKKGQLETAFNYALKAREIDAGEAMILVELGDIRRRLGETDQALNDLNGAIAMDSTLPVAYRTRGLILGTKGRLKDALNDFNEAVKLAPEDAESWASRAIVRSKLGQIFGAISDYSQALLLDPQQYENYFNRGLAYRKMGELKKAKRDFLQFLKLQPNHPLASRLRRIVQELP